MSYTIYTGEDCHDCEEVLELLKKRNIPFTEINVDKQDKKPPVPIFAYPSLFIDEKLIAYGFDILDKV